MLYQEEIRLIKKILSGIVSKPNISSKQNIKGALSVKDKNYSSVKSSCLQKQPQNPKIEKMNKETE